MKSRICRIIARGRPTLAYPAFLSRYDVRLITDALSSEITTLCCSRSFCRRHYHDGYYDVSLSFPGPATFYTFYPLVRGKYVAKTLERIVFRQPLLLYLCIESFKVRANITRKYWLGVQGSTCRHTNEEREFQFFRRTTKKKIGSDKLLNRLLIDFRSTWRPSASAFS